MKNKLTLRRIIIILILVLLGLLAKPISFLLYTYYNDQKPIKIQEVGYANDASNLNKTKIDTVVKVSENVTRATEQISELIKQAKLKNKKISIAGAQHSMGGHTIYPDGIVLDMKSFHYMELDSINNILKVGAGALWSEVIPFLDKRGKSIIVMQSNNSFSVGGSISVNCHGWQPNSAPIASTIESFRLINGDGQVINCSKNENEELFSLALGGYGLFGVIVDVSLRVVSNKMYKMEPHSIKSIDYTKEFERFTANNTKVGMAYGRINTNPERFMEEAIIYTFIADDSIPISPLKENGFKDLRRTVFRSSAKSNYGKNLRWKAEKFISSQLNRKKISRNQLLNEEVEVYQNGDTAYTDILHEYFIPKDSVIRFIQALKPIIPNYNVDLLNITIRNVKRDDETFLRYADEEVFGFVMLFNQEKNAKAEAEMKLLAQKLIGIAVSLKGTYYLPYRLHASKEQMYKAYPQAKDFFLLKKKYDPEEIFTNSFYETYK